MESVQVLDESLSRLSGELGDLVSLQQDLAFVRETAERVAQSDQAKSGCRTDPTALGISRCCLSALLHRRAGPRSDRAIPT
jgi:hypothetical protein